MSEIPIHPLPIQLDPISPATNPLPQLLCTPSGLALLELQGTINLPAHEHEDSTEEMVVNGSGTSQQTSIGRLVFPDYHPETQEPGSTAWTSRVYLYVGKHQRLTGEVKKLPKAIAIIRKRKTGNAQGNDSGTTSANQYQEKVEELEIVQVVKWKIIFSHRPEPVGTWTGEV